MLLGLNPAAPGPSPWSYLMPHRRAQIVDDDDDFTVANANVAAALFAAVSSGVRFRLRVTPSWDSDDTSNHPIWTIDSSNRLFWRGSGTNFNFRAGGSHQGFPNVDFVAGQPIILDWDFGANELQVYVAGAAQNTPNSFSNDWSAQSSADIDVGKDGSAYFDGWISPPILLAS